MKRRSRRNWINLAERMDKECSICGNIPSQLVGKSVRDLFTAKERKERKKDYGDLLVCELCVQCITDPPKGVSTEKKIKRPRGWQFMSEFVDSEGNVFHKGVEKKRLKGKLPVTDLKTLEEKRKENGNSKPKKEKISKWTKQEKTNEIASEIYKMKKEIKKLTGQPRTKSKITKLRREIKTKTQELKKWK